MHVVKHHSNPSLHFSITKISAIEIYFFDDAYSFDSSVFIGLYLISINLCSAHVLDFNCCLLWSVPLFLQISKESLFLPVQHSINCALDYSSVCCLYMRLMCPNCSSDCTSYVGLPSHVLRFVLLFLTVHWTVPPWCVVISIGFIYVKFWWRMSLEIRFCGSLCLCLCCFVVELIITANFQFVN